MNTSLTILKFLGIAVVLVASSAFAEVLVVVHPSNPVSSLNEQQIGQIFLGDSTTFPNGTSAIPVAMSSGAVRDEFLTKVLGKSAGQVKATWARIVFSGKGLPPRELPDPSGVKAFVAANPTAIGYIDSASSDTSIKVIFKAP